MPLSLCTIHFAAPIITIRVNSISVSAENTSEHILLTQRDYMGLSWCCFRSVMKVMGTINLNCRADMLKHTFCFRGSYTKQDKQMEVKKRVWRWLNGLRKWDWNICCQIATNLFTKFKLPANKWENWFFN